MWLGIGGCGEGWEDVWCGMGGYGEVWEDVVRYRWMWWSMGGCG